MLRRRESAVGKLGSGERLSDLIGREMTYVYRWVPDYAAALIRPRRLRAPRPRRRTPLRRTASQVPDSARAL
jgi:hypothetical protein